MKYSGLLAILLLAASLLPIVALLKVYASEEPKLEPKIVLKNLDIPPANVTYTFFDSPPEDAEYTSEGYLNTTNPYSDVLGYIDYLDEVTKAEGPYPIYVLVFVDKEEREFWEGRGLEWWQYTLIQLERADETLVAKFGIDIRVLTAPLGYSNLWESDDNLTNMTQIYEDLMSETYIFLGRPYAGNYWNGYVDCIVGITNQETIDNIAGLAALNISQLDQGKYYILLNWYVQEEWADDNLAFHEFAHLFYAKDHWSADASCCAMTQSHYHYVTVLWEEGWRYSIYGYVLCGYLQYDWCADCKSVINAYLQLFADTPYKLVIRHEDPYQPKGILNPIGVYLSDNPTNVTVSAIPNSGYDFDCWIIDGTQMSTSNPLNITLDRRHTVVAIFKTVTQPPPQPKPKRGGPGRWVLMC
jgi:hypothetical protein